MVNLDKIIKVYQGVLIEEYRELHQEETANLTDAEVALMNPLTKADIQVIKDMLIISLKREVQELQAEIKHDEESLTDSNTWKESIAEIRADIRDANIRLETLFAKINYIENMLKEEDTLEDENGCRSR